MFVCFNLVFFQGDLSHLSVAHEGACDLVDRLSCSHPDDVVGRYEAGSLSDLPLVKRKHRGSMMASFKSTDNELR